MSEKLEYNEYKEYYENTGFFIDDDKYYGNRSSEDLVRSKYRKYSKRFKASYKKKFEGKLDITTCTLIEKLEQDGHSDMLEVLRGKAPYNLLIQIDVAHIFRVSKYPKLKDDLHNVITLNRFSHFCLDNNRCPLTSEPIDKALVQSWWEYLAGDEIIEYLKRRLDNE